MFRLDGEVFLLETAIAAPCLSDYQKNWRLSSPRSSGKPAAAAGSSRTGRPIAQWEPSASAQAPDSAASPTKGLEARSWAKVDIGPWPGTKAVSPPIGHRRPVIESSNC